MKYIKEYKNIDWDFDEEESDVPDKFKGHEDFYDFLVDNGVLDKWINNLRIKNVHDFLNNNINRYYFDLAFFWKDTEEGFIFWHKINRKWLKGKI
jgi:DNA-binding transcriptional MocR family regulator